MNILFIHEIDWLRKVVIDFHWLAESMSLLGHRVYVLYYESMWGLNGLEAPKRAVVTRALPNARVELICPRFIKMPILSRVSAFATHYFGIKKVIGENEIDAIVLYSVPTNGLQTVHWAKHFNIPIVFRSIDVLNQLVPYSILRPITKFLEKKVYSSVDRILTITPKLSEYVVRMGADPNKVGILPVPVDTNLFFPSDDTSGLRKEWGIGDDDKVVLYMGTLFNFSGLDGFIPKFKHVINEFSNVKLLIVGDGEQRQGLESIIITADLQKSVTITGFQPYQDLPRYINMADVCVNPFVINDATRDIFPGKTVQILACGKPLVMRPLDGVKAIIAGEGQGVVYANDDSKMALEVLSLLKSDERRKKLGQNGLEYVKQNHDCRQVAKQLESVLVDLVGRKVVG